MSTDHTAAWKSRSTTRRAIGLGVTALTAVHVVKARHLPVPTGIAVLVGAPAFILGHQWAAAQASQADPAIARFRANISPEKATPLLRALFDGTDIDTFDPADLVLTYEALHTAKRNRRVLEALALAYQVAGVAATKGHVRTYSKVELGFTAALIVMRPIALRAVRSKARANLATIGIQVS